MIYQRVFFHECLKNCLGVMCVIIGLSAIFVTTRVLTDQVSSDFSFSVIGLIIFFSTIKLIPHIIAASVLFGIVLCVERLHDQNEFIAWQNAGVSLNAFRKQCLIFTFPFVIVTIWASLIGAPWAIRNSIQHMESALANLSVEQIRPGVFVYHQEGNATYIYKQHREGNEVFIAREQDGIHKIAISNHAQDIQHEDGRIDLKLEMGNYYQLDTAGQADDPFYHITYAEMTVPLARAHQLSSSFKNQATPLSQLWQNAAHQTDAQIELIFRLNFPIALFCLALLAIPITYFRVKSLRVSGYLAALMLFILMMNAIKFAENMAGANKIPPLATFMLPCVIVSLLFVALSYLLRQR